MGMVVTYAPRAGDGDESGLRQHEIATRVAVAKALAALEAFRRDPRLRAVHARSAEAYDADAPLPAGAMVHFRGVDRSAGPITKYTLVEPYERSL